MCKKPLRNCRCTRRSMSGVSLLTIRWDPTNLIVASYASNSSDFQNLLPGHGRMGGCRKHRRQRCCSCRTLDEANSQCVRCRKFFRFLVYGLCQVNIFFRSVWWRFPCLCHKCLFQVPAPAPPKLKRSTSRRTYSQVGAGAA